MKAPNFRELRDIAKKMHQSGLSQIELSGNGFRVSIKYAPLPPVIWQHNVQDTTPAAIETDAVHAPFPGTVLLQHPLHKIPFIRPGDNVGKDTLLGLLKVGVIYLPLRSAAQGFIHSLAVKNGDHVEYGTEIFLLRRTELAA